MSMSINTLTKFKIKIKLPYGELQPIVEWCDRNCKYEWRYMEDPNGDMYDSWIFFFENERDYVAFTLWNK
jgi:hypothetical protein